MSYVIQKAKLISWLTRVSVIVLVLSSLSIGTVQAAPSGAHTFPENTPGFIKHASDLGPVDPSTVITITAWLNQPNQNQLNHLVQQQNKKGSSSYHQWLTQDAFNARFAPSSQQINAVENFLTAHNLSVVDVAENNFYVNVKGTIAAIEKTFHVQIDRYSFEGKIYRSNTGNPSISAGPAAGLISSISGLDNYGYQPTFVRPTQPDGQPYPMIPVSKSPDGVFYSGQCFYDNTTQTFTDSTTTADYSGNVYGAPITNNSLGDLPPCGYSPSEMASAYNLDSLYSAGLDGSGQTIVIVDAYGSATIQQDAQAFSSIYGLPPIDLQVLRAPGVSQNPYAPGWATETTLDVEWAHAIAPGAKIVLVIGPTNHADLDQAVNWAVIHNLGNTISNSWSTYEGLGNPANFNRMNQILEMAAARGIDVNFATGDYGDNSLIFGFKTVEFPASSPYATGIGGVSVGLNSSNQIDFQSGWGTNLTKIAGSAADNNPPVNPPAELGFQFGAGGGTSMYYAKPSFQSSLPGNKRLVPDISWLADPYTGGEIIETVGGQLSFGAIGGTSLATPMFSGLMAIAAQEAGHPLGQAAQYVYDLPAGAITDVVPVGSASNVSGSIVSSSGTDNYSADQLAAPLFGTTEYFSAFYNSPFSTNWFVITFGTDTSLMTAPGWDNVTGVGTPNGYNFVTSFAP